MDFFRFKRSNVSKRIGLWLFSQNENRPARLSPSKPFASQASAVQLAVQPARATSPSKNHKPHFLLGSSSSSSSRNRCLGHRGSIHSFANDPKTSFRRRRSRPKYFHFHHPTLPKKMSTATKLGVGAMVVAGLSGLGGLLHGIFGKRKSQDGAGGHRRRRVFKRRRLLLQPDSLPGFWAFLRHQLKCCTAAPEPPDGDADDNDETDGMEDVHRNVTVTCCGARATVENEAIIRTKSHTSLPPWLVGRVTRDGRHGVERCRGRSLLEDA